MSPNKILQTTAAILNTRTAQQIRETARITCLIKISEPSVERKLTINNCIKIKLCYKKKIKKKDN